MGLPMSLFQDAGSFKSGQISAQRYWGNVAADTAGFSVWGAGALLAGSLLGGVGFLPMVAGFAVGTVAYSAFSHTLGRSLSDLVAEHLPAGSATKAADWVVKHLTDPFDKYVMAPISRHWQIFAATAVGSLLAGGAAERMLTGSNKGLVSVAKGAGAMLGVSSAVQLGADPVFGDLFPEKPVQGVDLTPGAGQAFNPVDGTIGAAPSSTGG
ncbi:MAG: hypothetical protein KGR26_11495, partial [Cyanobacteria bacterium REEB65]|nr:hypothetical protein [Cyanobacteria bacterium REEB65]